MNETTANYRLQSYAEREAAEKARWGKALAKPTTASKAPTKPKGFISFIFSLIK